MKFGSFINCHALRNLRMRLRLVRVVREHAIVVCLPMLSLFSPSPYPTSLTSPYPTPPHSTPPHRFISNHFFSLHSLSYCFICFCHSQTTSPTHLFHPSLNHLSHPSFISSWLLPLPYSPSLDYGSHPLYSALFPLSARAVWCQVR